MIPTINELYIHGGYGEGMYLHGSCRTCKQEFQGSKGSYNCLKCAIPITEEALRKLKDETCIRIEKQKKHFKDYISKWADSIELPFYNGQSVYFILEGTLNKSPRICSGKIYRICYLLDTTNNLGNNLDSVIVQQYIDGIQNQFHTITDLRLIHQTEVQAIEYFINTYLITSSQKIYKVIPGDK